MPCRRRRPDQPHQPAVARAARAAQGAGAGEVTVSTETSTKYFGFIRVSAGGDLLPGTSGSPEAKAQAFLAKYGSLLGVGDAAGSLVEADVETDEQDATHVTYAQRYKGVPVFSGAIKAHVDEDGNLTASTATSCRTST